MPWNWSAPNFGSPTQSQLAAPYTYHAPDISGVLRAIMAQRAQQQERNAQQAAAVTKSISDAFGSYGRNKDQSALADYMMAQRTAQQSGTPGGFSEQMQEDISHMSPQAQVGALEYTQQHQSDALRQQLANQLVAARIANQLSMADNRNGDALNQRHQQLMEDDIRKAQIEQAKANLMNAAGVQASDVPSVMSSLNNYQPGQTAFPAIGTHKAINDASQGGYKDALLSAAQAYRNILSTPVAQPAGRSMSGPPQGTKGVVNGQPVVWDGYGWVADASATQ